MSDSIDFNDIIVIAELFHAMHKVFDIIRDTDFAPRSAYQI